MTLWSGDLLKSPDKLKQLYHHYHGAYGHETWYSRDILCEAPNHKVIWCFDHVACTVTWQKSFFHNQIAYCYKLGRMVPYLDEFPPIKSHHPLITWSCKITWQTKTIISTLPVSVATKLARMVIFLDRLLILKSCKALIMWSCKVTWQTKTIISLLQECLWQLDLVEWWLLVMVSSL